MKSQEIACRYAEALHSLAGEEDRIEEVEKGYREVVSAVAEVPEFDGFFAHLLVPGEAKIKLLKTAFPELSPYLFNLFFLLVRNRRENYLSLIYKEFIRLCAEAEGVMQAEATVARKLSTTDHTRLASCLGRAMGCQIELEEKVDPGLLGGVRIEINGKVIDGTLRAKLGGLKNLLEG